MIAPLSALSALLLSALTGCEEPGTLSALTDAYAASYLPVGGPALRYGIALSSLTAELCAADDPARHEYIGYGARALSLGEITAQIGQDGGLILTFDETGIDDDPGTLQVSTDATRTQWRHTLTTGKGQIFSATANVADCADPTRINVSTSGTWVGPTEFTMVEGGITFNADNFPILGQPKWVDSTNKIDLTLVPAEDLTEDGPWPGLMLGPGWESRVAVDW